MTRVSNKCIAYSLSLYIGSIVFAPCALTAELSHIAIDSVAHIFATEYAAHPYGGIAVGIVSGHELRWFKSYGWADVERKTPATKNTVYRIGSVTKQFTALALLQLVERGKIKPFDPVERYLPEIKDIRGWPPSQPITLLDLATHRAGLAAEPENCQRAHEDKGDCIYQVGSVSTWEQTLLSALPHVRLETDPEIHVAYSNIGYAILGAALGNAAGQPYTEYVARSIFAPLGMRSTGFEPSPNMLARLASGYVITGNSADKSEAAGELRSGRGYKVPNGGIFTTVRDLSKFVMFEMGEGPESVLAHEVLRGNFERSFTWDNHPGWSYGVGFMTTTINGHTIIGHSGAVAGYRAGVFFNPESKLGIVCLQNATLLACPLVAVTALATMIDKQYGQSADKWHGP